MDSRLRLPRAFDVFSYYRGTHGVIVVYDVTNGDSFVDVKRWLHEIDQNCETVSRILGKEKVRGRGRSVKFNHIVGNKCDCPPDRRIVDKNDAQKFADQMGIDLYETSAKDNVNIEDVGGCFR